MKIKILIFFGLLFASIGALSLLHSPQVLAAGERYVWINQDTIEGTEGAFKGLNGSGAGGSTGQMLRFARQPNGTFRALSNGGSSSLFFNCGGITWTLTVGADRTTGSLDITSAPSATCDSAALQKVADKKVAIGNPLSGPPMEGQDVDYRTVDCAAYYEGGDGAVRCEAVKKCVVDHGVGQIDCLRSWYTCIIVNTTDRQRCIDAISAGNIAEAIKGGVTAPPAKEEEGKDKTTCVIPGVGWIICPVLTFMATLTDGAYYVVSAFLTVQPILSDGSSKGLYDAWQVMRNFANVAFVIVFLIIIFSQVTSFGITNYGIKRLLPRLIVAAVLVNISYWLCSIAVDLSNITGTSLKGLFDAAANQITIPQASAAATGVGLAGVAGTILSGALVGIGLYVAIGALIPVLLACLVTIAVVFISLIIRQALIVLLIAISPLAFVAYLLPNTESLFNRWRGLFWTLLVMYPIIALVFGASALASKIVMVGA